MPIPAPVAWPLAPRRRRLLAALVLCAGSLSVSPRPQAAADEATDLARRVDRLLAAPPSPEAEVLLVEGAADARVRARWRASLRHADPRVRGAAARAIRVALPVDLRPDIEAVLATESDPLAASEQADALIELTGGAHPTVLAAARRLPRPVATTVVLTLMRVAPAVLTDHLIDLWPSEGHDEAGAALADLVSTLPAASAPLVTALIRSDLPGAWPAVRRAYAGSDPPDLSPVALALALGGKTTEMREDALLILLHQQLRRGAPSPLAPELEAAVFGEVAQPTTPVADVARELLARHLGATARVTRPLETLLPLIPPESAFRDPWNWDVVAALLTPTERTAAGAGPVVVRKPKLDQTKTPEPTPRLVSVADLPPGVLEGVLRGAGCASSNVGLAAGTVEYNERGRPRALSVPSFFSDACRRRIVALLRLGVVHGSGTRVVLMPLKPRAEFGTRMAVPVFVSGELRPQDGGAMPTLVHQVKPQYTQAAMDARVEGRVWMRVLIDEEGGVRQIEVERQLHPDLNREALLAMLGWKFAPAVRQGARVASRVAVEMEFKLK
jgi:TonB family protein